MSVDFTYIGESELLKALTQPGQEGRGLYWFDATILTPKWFKQSMDRALKDAGPRYTRQLNVNLPIATVFEGLGRTHAFQKKWRTAWQEVRSAKKWEALRTVSGTDHPLIAQLNACQRPLDDLDRQLAAIEIPGTKGIDFVHLTSQCQAVLNDLDEVIKTLMSTIALDTEDNRNEREKNPLVNLKESRQRYPLNISGRS